MGRYFGFAMKIDSDNCCDFPLPIFVYTSLSLPFIYFVLTEFITLKIFDNTELSFANFRILIFV